MADSNRLHGVASGNGWKERVEHFLLKKSAAVLSANANAAMADMAAVLARHG